MTTSGSNFIGIDLSGPKVRAALVTDQGEILERHEAEMSPQDMVEQISTISRNLSSGREVGALGIAIPGLVNRQTDRVVVSRYLPSSVREDLHSELMRATGHKSGD